MSKEKEVIEYLKEVCDDYIRFFGEEDAKKCEDYKRSKTLINLIDKQQKEIEKLKEKLNGERDFTKATLETLKECIHKEDLRRLFQSYMKRLNEELSTYDENDIENRTACQYAKAKLRFLLGDIYKLLGY